MMIKYQKILLLLLFISLNCYALNFTKQKDCSSLDLRKTKKGKKLLSKVYNQKNELTCYAYPTADLISFKMNTRVSAFYIYGKQSLLQGARVVDTIKYLINSGSICLEKDAPSLDGVGLNAFHSTYNILNLLDKLKDKTDQHSKIIFKRECLQLISDYSHILKKIHLNDLIKIIKTDQKQKLNLLIKRLCKSRKKKLTFSSSNVIKINSIANLNNDNLIGGIHKALNKKQPVALTYAYSDLFAIKKRMIVTANHVSTIMGRRFNQQTKQCEFLIKDSHGKHCMQKPSEGFTCEYDNKNKATGFFWLDEEAVRKYSSSIIYIN